MPDGEDIYDSEVNKIGINPIDVTQSDYICRDDAGENHRKRSWGFLDDDKIDDVSIYIYRVINSEHQSLYGDK